MQALLAPLGEADGVACFTRLYLAVTQGVAARLAGVEFADPAFLAQLDVRFADLFFAAIERPTPAWAPLFQSRTRKGIAPLQFALAGMNAHINRDLPVALVDTCTELGRELRPDSPEHQEFLRVNALLARVERKVKASYATGIAGLLTRLFHRADDAVANFSVDRARDAAWANGLALWKLRDEPAIAAEFLGALDRMVGLAGRGLLVQARLRRFF